MDPRRSASRKNVTTACKACRESKTKCDGRTPQCGNCTKKDRDCHYEAKEDRRRLSFRPALRILRDRIDVLTKQLVEAGVTPSVLDASDENTANKVLEALRLSALSSIPPSDSHAEPTECTTDQRPSETNSAPLEVAPLDETILDVGQATAFGGDAQALQSLHSSGGEDTGLMCNFDDSVSFAELSQMNWNDNVSPLDWPWIGPLVPELDTAALLNNPAEPFESTSRGTKRGNADYGTSGESGGEEEAESELVNQIASRFGSLHITPDGKLRYFGTTANAHLFDSGRVSGPSSTPRSLELEGENLLQNANLSQHVDAKLEEHLIGLFFSWHNSCHMVMDQAIYWKCRKQWKNQENHRGLYSPVLTNTMCAIGASFETRYHANLVTFPRTLGDFFAERAKILLEIDLDSPCVSTVQALLLLSSHESGVQRTARSWLYSGMAMRLCFDLGLHIDASSYVEQGVMSHDEAQMRQMAFWAAYVQNYRTSFTLGRPFTLDPSEIQVQKPSHASRSACTLWRAYPLPSGTESEETTVYTGLISEQRIILCNLVEPVARALYGNATISPQFLQQISHDATSAMFHWKENQAEVLRINMQTNSGVIVPQLVVLHLEYHYLQILVHRPWTSRRLQPQPAQGHGYRHARQICIDSAIEMGQLLLTFEQRFGYRRIDVETSQMLPSAALILIFAMVSTSDEGIGDIECGAHLNTFLRALDELSNVYPSSRQHLESLLFIQERWGALYKKRNRKRANERRGNSTNGKRPRHAETGLALTAGK